ncbi:MAG: ATP-binding protein [Eubacteriales bacterium]|nr:ATP-binding protein [Eubacteriales bacterium]
MDNKQVLSLEDYELCNKLKSMRFSGMSEELENVLADPNSELLPYREIVQRIINAEWELRYTKKLNRYVKKATLKYPSANLDETIYDPERQLDHRIIEELAKCSWIDQGKNLIITGKTSSGKSYLANALCVSALRQFRSARYTKASQLINELTRAEHMDTYQDVLNTYSKYDLLIIDDFGLMSLDIDQCRNLFQVLDSRDPFRSTMLVSQFPVSAWYDLFQDNTYAEACLTRILNDSYRIEMNGKNMRNLEPLKL